MYEQVQYNEQKRINSEDEILRPCVAVLHLLQ